MEVTPATSGINSNDGGSSVTAEVYFLIARLLADSPCRATYEALQRELETHELLPRRVDWLGNQHKQTFTQVCRQFAHVRSNHLLEICRRLGPLVDEEVPTNVRGVRSLLGAGRQSVLRRKEDLARKLTREHYVVRQNQRPRFFPADLSHAPHPVHLLQSRELTGSTDQRSVVPAKLYSRVQLFCRTLGHLSAVYCVLFDRTGQFIFTGADDLLVKIWSAVTGRLLATLRGASAEIADLAVSYDNTLLAAGSCDKIVRVWCLRTTAPVAVLTGHGGTVTSINFCPADRAGTVRYLASTSSDGSVSFWEYIVEPGQTPKFFPKPHKFNEKIRPGQAQMLCASFSPGGMFMATGCADHHVRVYVMFAPEGPERILEMEAHADRVDSIQWANSGLRFISGSKDGTALIWRYERQEWRTIRLRMTSRLDGGSLLEDAGQKLKVTMVTWSREDQYVFTAVSDFSIKVWDSTSGTLHKELRGHEGEAFVLEPHPHDPNVLLSAGHDGRLLVWDLAKGEVLKSFLNFIEGQGHGAVFDAKWNPSGSTIAATDSHGHLSIYGIGPSERFKKLPKAIFFHTDYRPLIRDAHHHVLDEQTQLAPHLMPPPFLVDSEGNAYPPALQRLVPGREHLRDDQLVPTVVVNASGEPEIVASVEVPAAPLQAGADNNAAEASSAQAQPQPSHAQQQRTRSNIDQMIEELAQQQERQRHRPRSTAAAVPSTSSAQASSEHSYTSRQPPREVSSLPGTSRTSTSQGEVDENQPAAAMSTEATATESLPGYSRRCIVKPLTGGQLESDKADRQCWADEEVKLFYLEVQRKSPDIFQNTSVSPGLTALLAARSRGVSDDGWSPSRPRRNYQPSRPVRRERAAVPASPARSRIPPVSPASRRTSMAPPPQQPSQQHSYRTRANRANNEMRDRTREGVSDGLRERSRRVVRQVLSSDDGDGDEDVEVEEVRQTRSRRTSPRNDESDGAEEEDEEERGRPTRSTRQRQQRNGDALSTSDSDGSESDLSSGLLESDNSDSEAQGSSSDSSSEYSDWTAEAGVNLEPPKRTRKRVYRRPRCLSSEEEAAAGPGPSSMAAGGNSNDGAEDAEGGTSPAQQQQVGQAKKRRAAAPQRGTSALDPIPESFRPSEWLSEVIPRRTPFYPQMGDEVVYFRQGHELYVEAIKNKKLFELNPRYLPWSNQNIRDQELVKIIGIKYELKPPRLCCLKLGLIDSATGALTGESFTVKYHDMADVLDFLVLRQSYELAMQRNWKPGDIFRCIIDDLWWEGQLETREPYSSTHPDSMFLCYRVRWDSAECDRMSPWDLEPVDPERRPPTAGTGVTVLPQEIASTLYRPKAEDWPPGGDRDAECERISAGLSQVMSLAIAEAFSAPVDLNMYPTYAYIVEYPIDLSTIKARLDNRFYRRVTAVQYDVRYIYTNACKFNQPKSDIVRAAWIITELCLEIIRNQDAEDATSIYHRLVERYNAGHHDGEGADEVGQAGASGRATGRKNGTAPNTPNTRSRSRRSSPQNTDSDESDKETTQTGKGKSGASKSKDKRITTRLAAAATLSWKQQCKDLLETLRRSDDSSPFREPVNILEYTDYLDIIDHPMDLGTVREQLQVGNYHSPMDFAKDVRLIFENSKKYNTIPKSRIVAMTIRLSAVFEEHMRPILTAYKHSKSQSSKGKSKDNHQRANESKSRKGKALAPTSSRSAKDSKRIGKGSLSNGKAEPPIKMVLSRASNKQVTIQPQPADSARRRILEDDSVDARPATKRPCVEAEGASDESYIDAQPGPSGLSHPPAHSAAAEVGKRGGKRLMVKSEDEDDSDESPESENIEPSEQVKGKALKKKDNPSTVKYEVEEPEAAGSTDEDETPISQRRRGLVTQAKAAPVPAHVKTEPKEDIARPSSSSSNASNTSKENSSSSCSGSLCSDTFDPNGNPLRRSSRARRKPKRPLDSEQSENDANGAHSSKSTRRSVRTRNGGRRTAVRYRDSDSEEEVAKGKASRGDCHSHQQSARGGGSKRRLNSSEEDLENDDPKLRRQTNGGGGKRLSRQSAQEASKKIRHEFATTSEDDDDEAQPAVPTYSISSRGRVRKIVHHSTGEFVE